MRSTITQGISAGCAVIGAAAAAAVGVTAALWVRRRDQDRMDRYYTALAGHLLDWPGAGDEAGETAPGVQRPGLVLIRGGAR